jgi:hypothetical protein
MPSFKVQKSSSQTAQETFKKISDLLSNDKDLRKLDAKYAAQFDKDSLSGKAEGSMFKAQMNVLSEGAGSKVEIVVDLPFHLALVKGMVEKTLQKKLDEVLA